MSADVRSGSEWSSILLTFLKVIFPILIIFVHYFSSDAVLRYSQDLIAKNKAPIVSHETARSRLELERFNIFLNTINGSTRYLSLVPS